MNNMLWSRLDAEFAKFPILRGDASSEEAINAAETRLGCRFHTTYREFLRRYGSGIVGSEPILGLSHAEAMGDDLWSVVDVTERFRREGWPDADRWYVLAVDGSGNPIGVDEAGRVLCFDHDAGKTYEIASSFEEYLVRLLN